MYVRGSQGSKAGTRTEKLNSYLYIPAWKRFLVSYLIYSNCCASFLPARDGAPPPARNMFRNTAKLPEVYT
jgi:hypothetical protein